MDAIYWLWGTLYGMFMWFRDVINEAEHKGDHTPVVQIGMRYGMVLLLFLK